MARVTAEHIDTSSTRDGMTATLALSGAPTVTRSGNATIEPESVTVGTRHGRWHATVSGHHRSPAGVGPAFTLDYDNPSTLVREFPWAREIVEWWQP